MSNTIIVDISLLRDPDCVDKLRPYIQEGDRVVIDAQQIVDAAIQNGVPMPLPPEGFKLNAAERRAFKLTDEAARRFEAHATQTLRECWEAVNG